MPALNVSGEVNPQRIREIKRRAKQMSKTRADKSYMQCLDIVSREEMGLRHFHEAQKLAVKGPQQSGRASDSTPETPWIMYLQACQEAYFEI